MTDPISWRNNNPGNLRGKYFGATGSSGGFATYPSMDAGWNAMAQQLDRYYQGKTTGTPLRTVRQIIGTWAPPTENDTGAYAARVAKDLGVDPDQPLNWTPEVKQRLMTSMATHEAGKTTVAPNGTVIAARDIAGDPDAYPGGDIVPVSGEHNVVGTLPPGGDGPLELPPDSSDNFAANLAANPFLQMGLGIMGSGNLGLGAQRGLMAAARFSELQQRRKLQQRQQQRGPDLQTIQQGDQTLTGYFGPDGRFQQVSSAPRWQPQRQPQPPQPSANVRDYEYLIAQGVDPEEARKQAFGGGGVNISMGSTPQGSRPVTDDQGNVTGYQPLPGSPAYRTLEDDLSKLNLDVENADRMIELVRSHGSEGTPFVSNPKIRGEMDYLYGRLLAAVAGVNNLGVLQEGERQALEERFPNPANLSSNLVSDERMVTAFQGLRNEVAKKRDLKQSQLGAGAGALSPEEQAELQALRQQQGGS